MPLSKCAYCNAIMSPLWPSCATCHRPLAGTASDAEPLPPEGVVGRHWRACPTCNSTWQWPTISGATGKPGWTCATCLVNCGQSIRIMPKDGREPVTVAPADQAAGSSVYEMTHPKTGQRFTTTLYACPKCGGSDWGPTGAVEPDGAERWACRVCGPSAEPLEPEGMAPAAPIGQQCGPCPTCSGSWHLPMPGQSWICAMCKAREAAQGVEQSELPACGLKSLSEFLDRLTTHQADSEIAARDFIELFSPFEHALRRKVSAPREVWTGLEDLGYEVRGQDSPQPMVMGLRLTLGEG